MVPLCLKNTECVFVSSSQKPESLVDKSANARSKMSYCKTTAPSEFTIKELAELVIAKTKSRSTFVTQPLPEDDPRQRCPDITLAKDLLHWNPTVPLADGLVPTIEYFQKSFA